MTNELNDFLDAEGGPADVDPPAAGAAPTLPADDQASGQSPAAPAPGETGAAPAAPAAAAPVVPPVEEPEVIPEDVLGLRAALTAERGKRNDHKGRADRAEGELTATKAALEELRRAAQPAPAAPAAAAPVATPAPGGQPAAPAIPNPVEDPAGYTAYHQRMLFNSTLNLSEANLRRHIANDADVDEKIGGYKKAVAANPSLHDQLARQVDPYQFVYDTGKRFLAMEKIGSDPVAYEARVEAELRAKILAEAGGTPPAPAPAATDPIIPRSIGTATSSGPRTAAVTEAPDFETIFAPRKRAKA